MGCTKYQTSHDANRVVHDTVLHLDILSNTVYGCGWCGIWCGITGGCPAARGCYR
jgi:hypothetical protein